MRDQTAMTMNQTAARAVRAPQSLWRDQAGAVAVWVALGLVMFLPAAAIAVELTRLQVLETEIQQAADAAALAAATRINFTQAGMDAATTAANAAVANFERMATDADAPKIDIVNVTFLWGLPPAPQTNYTAYTTTSPSDARYVRVRTELREFRSTLMSVWSVLFAPGGDFVYDVSATAVAGRNTVACRPAPLMTCNPAESSADPLLSSNPSLNGPGEGNSFPASPTGGFARFGDFLRANPEFTRALMRIRFESDRYGPGLFGLLQPIFNEGRGADAIRDELGLINPLTCLQLDRVELLETRGGNVVGPVQDGINTRFGIYPNGNDGRRWRADPNFAPAPNVTKGLRTNNGCSERYVATGNMNSSGRIQYGSPDYAAFPQDTCFLGLSPTGECATVETGNGDASEAGRIGNGEWDILRYFHANHRSLIDTSTGQISTATANALRTMEQDIFAELGRPAPARVTLAPNWNPSRTWNTTTLGDSSGNPPTSTPYLQSIRQFVSRYAVYRWELANNLVPGSSRTGSIEQGRPSGTGSGNNACPAPDPDHGRRILTIAVVNCRQYQNLLQPNRNLPVFELLEAFITEPIPQSASRSVLHIEPLRTVDAGNNVNSNIVLRDVVQLY